MGDLEVAIRAALGGFQANLWTALPGIIHSFNAAALTVEAQPSIQAQQRLPNGTWQTVNLPLCVDCPVIFPGGGGFYLTAPLASGDEGLIVFASRCIDAWWQQGGVQTQAELRMHDLSDGFFIPGAFSQPRVLPSVSTTSAQLRNQAGDTYVEIAGGQIVNIVAPGGVKITGNVEVTGTLKADELETGESGLNITGNITATGSITAGQGGGDQVGLQTHEHPTAGTGAPSPPTPGT